MKGWDPRLICQKGHNEKRRINYKHIQIFMRDDMSITLRSKNWENTWSIHIIKSAAGLWKKCYLLIDNISIFVTRRPKKVLWAWAVVTENLNSYSKNAVADALRKVISPQMKIFELNSKSESVVIRSFLSRVRILTSLYLLHTSIG